MLSTVGGTEGLCAASRRALRVLAQPAGGADGDSLRLGAVAGIPRELSRRRNI